MAMAICCEVGDIVPVSLLLSDGSADLYPQVVVKDEGGVVLTTLDLGHSGNGEYTPASSYLMPDAEYVKLIYVVYTDAGHTTEATDYPRDIDVITKISPNDYKADVSGIAANETLIKQALALIGKNYRLKDVTRDSMGNMTSSTVVGYANSTDADNDVNAIVTLAVTGDLTDGRISGALQLEA